VQRSWNYEYEKILQLDDLQKHLVYLVEILWLQAFPELEIQDVYQENVFHEICFHGEGCMNDSQEIEDRWLHLLLFARHRTQVEAGSAGQLA
jgi:hypothetical protein